MPSLWFGKNKLKFPLMRESIMWESNPRAAVFKTAH
uniref:Uncharacterized protein n=1 Tax=Siphoviridae sp. ctDwe1 TaxID=2826200 RepID=A0A8S5M5S7_9CAUD|nr:MAG TPA: hypothetical protein [Siphoviridae sp. ctDwe1]